VILFSELFVDDCAKLTFDLIARHLLERLKVDNFEQLLVELYLQIGLLVAVVERTRIIQLDQSPLV
jgi:hypothetical protein